MNVGKPKVTFLFNPRICACCHAKTDGRQVNFKTVVDGIERRFVFCAACIDDQPTQERCRELLRRIIGFDDALGRGEEEERVRSLLR